MSTDFVPSDDRQKKDELISALNGSVGAIRRMRKWLTNYFAGAANADPEGRVFDGLPAEKVAEAMRLRGTRVRRDSISNGIVVACPLKVEEGHFPIRAVYEGIGACAALMLVQLAAERPIRGGLDVGTGLEIDGELFGTACVKAYEIESKRTKYPRLIVGKGLVDYLHTSLQAHGQPLDRQFERKMAEEIIGLLKKDFDDEWIVDYAGPEAHRLFLIGSTGPDVLKAARAFAHRARERFRKSMDPSAPKLFERYSQLVRYLDASGP